MNLFIKRNNLLASDICLAAASLFHFIQQKEKETYSTSSCSDPLPSRWTKDSKLRIVQNHQEKLGDLSDFHLALSESYF